MVFPAIKALYLIIIYFLIKELLYLQSWGFMFICVKLRKQSIFTCKILRFPHLKRKRQNICNHYEKQSYYMDDRVIGTDHDVMQFEE